MQSNSTQTILVELRGGPRTYKVLGLRGKPRGSIITSYAKIDKKFASVILKTSWCLRNGYAVSNINNRLTLMHHLVFFLAHGRRLKGTEEIDHIDRNPLNNTIENIRLATSQLNKLNRGSNRNNTCGYKGVSFLKHRNVWQARLWINYKPLFLGSYRTKEEAAVVINDAYKLHHPEVPIPNPQVEQLGIKPVKVTRASRYTKRRP